MSKGKRKEKPKSPKVLALLDQLQRRRGIRELEKRFLIVCEDGKSAPAYFEALKRYFNLSASSIRVVGSGDGKTQPIQVVTKAVELKGIAENDAKHADDDALAFSEVWCAIDGDYGSKIANARAKAKTNGVKLAVSTKCFEYWVILHYEQYDSPTLNCAALVKRLETQHITDYEKGKCKFHDTVTRVEVAAERAEKSRRLGELPENQNPCSEIFKLIEAIKAAKSSSP